MTFTCDGGTRFDVKNGQVTITKSNQPVCVIPWADIREFIDLYDLEEVDDE